MLFIFLRDKNLNISQLSRIKIIGPAWPYRGGIAAFNEKLATELQKSGHSVIIETFTVQYPTFLFPGKTQYSDSEAPADLNIKRTINSMNPFNWFKVGRRIRLEKHDLIIFKFWLPFMGPCLGTIARQIRRNKFSRIIAVLDNIIPHEPRAGDNLLTKYFVLSQDGFISMSDSVMQDLKKFTSSSPGLYSPHPVYDNYGIAVTREIALRNLELDPGFRYILFFGLIRDYKGLDLLIRAFSDHRFRDKKIKILVAGEFYSDPEPIYKMISEGKLEEKVIIKSEFIPDSEVANWFCASDLIVQPYKSATQSGITQIGYHFEKPMLVSNVGGLPEIITHNKSGYVVEPEPDQIADAIDDFYTNQREGELIEGVKSDKAKFSWEEMIESIFKLASMIDK